MDDGITAMASTARSSPRYLSSAPPDRSTRSDKKIMVTSPTSLRGPRGMIRAENTTRETRKRATTAQQYADMIGFAASDQIALFRACQTQYGQYVQKAWVPLG